MTIVTRESPLSMNTFKTPETLRKIDYRSYTVMGNPIALARPRFSAGGKVWDSQKNSKFGWQLDLTRQHEDYPLFAGPLKVDIIFYMNICHKKRKIYLPGLFHFFKPDIDNLAKFTLDCLNKIVIEDDALVSVLKCSKVYDPHPRTEITITKLD